MWKKYRAKPGEKIPLGRSGEHLARTIVFDISSWEQNYGEGVVGLLHQRRGDTAPYPVDIEQDGNIVRWRITEADNAVSGTGRAELQYVVGDVVVKSDMYYTVTKPSIGASTGETPPEPEKAWVDKVIRAGAAAEAVQQAAEEAAQAANSSSDLANAAAATATAACGRAEAAQNGAEAAKGAAVDAQAAAGRAKTAAETAASAAAAAQQAAEEAHRLADDAKDLADLLASEAADAAETAQQAAEEARASAEEADIFKQIDRVVSAIIAPEYDPDENYSAGDLVFYEGSLFRFTVDHIGKGEDLDPSEGEWAVDDLDELMREAARSRKNMEELLGSANSTAQKAMHAAEAAKEAAEVASIVINASGSTISVLDSAERPPKKLRLFGKTTQNGTPSWENPIPLVSPGDSGSITVSIGETQTLIAQTPNGLPGIPNVASGNYKENGRMWLGDVIDFARGKYIKYIERGIVDITSVAKLGNGLPVGVYDTPGKKNVTGPAIISSHAQVTTSSYSPGFVYQNGVNVCFVGDENDTKETLQAKYNGSELLYMLANPIEIDLTAEEMAQYAALLMEFPNTAATNDAGAWMELQYVADTKTYIDNKFTQLSAAVIAAGTT